MNLPHQNSQFGFTLLEILAALAIAAVGMVAISRGLGASIHMASALDNRTIAGWVAANQMTQLHLERAWPAPGETPVTVKMAGRSWYVSQRITTTLDQQLRRVDIKVYLDAGYRKQVGSLFGFLVAPQQKLPTAGPG